MSATQTQNDEATARQLLLSLRLLDSRRQRLEHELDATKKRFKDDLSEVTKRMNAKIDDGLPIDDSDCRGRLRLIQNLFRERQRVEEDKSEALDKAKSALKSVEASIIEVIRSEPSAQQSLEFDAEAGEGLSLTTDTARVIAEAIRNAEDEGAEMGPDMEELRERLANMGATLRVVGEDDKPKPKPKNSQEVLKAYDDAALGKDEDEDDGEDGETAEGDSEYTDDILGIETEGDSEGDDEGSEATENDD